VDDDGDGGIDFRAGGDIGCQTLTSATENPLCQNGLDDEGDGQIDFDGGASRNGGIPLGPADTHCIAPYRDRERPPPACGLGAELVFAIGALESWRRRRSRAAGARA
jgi:hypothetical protein